MEPTDNTDLAFVLWLDEVSALCQKHGLCLKDLPEKPTKDDYDTGETPEDYVNSHVLGPRAEGNRALTFKQWLRQVDVLCEATLGLGLRDLVDLPTRDAYESGETPEDFFHGTVKDELRSEFGNGIDEIWPAEG